LALEKRDLLKGWVFPHELNHLGFNKIISADKYAKRKGNKAELIYLTLLEGVAMVTSSQFCLSKTSFTWCEDVLNTYLDKSRVSASFKKWEKTNDSELISCMKNGDTFFYYVGANFINKIIKPKEKFVSLVERIRNHYPTAKEILNHREYQKV
jgi:hypothetical protein